MKTFLEKIEAAVTKNYVKENLKLSMRKKHVDNGEEILTVTARLPNVVHSVGDAEFLLNTKTKLLKALEIGVDEDFRRLGIATLIYDYAEEQTHLKVTPGDDQTEEIEHFWEHRGV